MPLISYLVSKQHHKRYLASVGCLNMYHDFSISSPLTLQNAPCIFCRHDWLNKVKYIGGFLSN